MWRVGAANGQFAETAGEASPAAAFGQASWQSVKHLIESAYLGWVPSPGCCASSLSQPFSLVDHLSILGRAGKKWASWEASHTTGEAEYSFIWSYFPTWGKLQTNGMSLGSEFCCLGGEVTQIKWTVLIFFNTSVLRFVAPTVLELFYWIQNTYKCTLVPERLLSNPWILQSHHCHQKQPFHYCLRKLTLLCPKNMQWFPLR